MKNMNVAVYDTIKAVKDGSFKGGVYVGTLENNGVGLAAVTGASADLMKELDQVKADIISGKITIK
jgi:basic membrane protein A